MDKLADMDSLVHAMGPLAKLAVTVVYIVSVMSFDKMDFDGLFVMLLFPVIWYQLAFIPVSTCFYRLRLVLPLVLAVGIFNPLLDRQICGEIFGFAVSRGFITMLTLMLKGVESLLASFLLVATTGIDSLCRALRKIHMPRLFCSLVLLTYRYIAVLLDEASAMMDAYMLRSPGQKGVAFKAWGSFLGQLLLRSMDRSRELYESMELRGGCGDFRYAEERARLKLSPLFAGLTAALILIFRFADIPGLITGLLR